VERYEELDLPAGLYEGLEIFKPEQGRYDVRAGRNGDLIVKIKLLKHPLLSTNGKDITCAVPVTIYEALLGAEIEAPCATGKVKMKIQPLTQPGRVYRLKGLGLGGDQLVTIEVMLPARLSADEVTAYKRLRDNYHEPNPREKYFQQQ
jgi:DnaJ-class molecular chaperone